MWRQLKDYNLNAIMRVGYRVNSRRGTQFRIWPTRTLRDHLPQGYTLNERRLAERGLDDVQRYTRTWHQQAIAPDLRIW